jgi:hypothetical protein
MDSQTKTAGPKAGSRVVFDWYQVGVMDVIILQVYSSEYSSKNH